MFRKPNTPGRKRSWELQPGDLPPGWIAQKYGGFEDMENNAVFRYVKTFGKLPKERLEDLRLTSITSQEIIEGYVAGLNPSGRLWFRRMGVRHALMVCHRQLPKEPWPRNIREVAQLLLGFLVMVTYMVFCLLLMFNLTILADKISKITGWHWVGSLFIAGLPVYVFSFVFPHIPPRTFRFHDGVARATEKVEHFFAPRD